jgi:hypothetical protein
MRSYNKITRGLQKTATQLRELQNKNAAKQSSLRQRRNTFYRVEDAVTSAIYSVEAAINNALSYAEIAVSDFVSSSVTAIHDKIFTLGNESLRATQTAEKIEKLFSL